MQNNSADIPDISDNLSLFATESATMLPMNQKYFLLPRHAVIIRKIELPIAKKADIERLVKFKIPLIYPDRQNEPLFFYFRDTQDSPTCTLVLVNNISFRHYSQKAGHRIPVLPFVDNPEPTLTSLFIVWCYHDVYDLQRYEHNALVSSYPVSFTDSQFPTILKIINRHNELPVRIIGRGKHVDDLFHYLDNSLPDVELRETADLLSLLTACPGCMHRAVVHTGYKKNIKIIALVLILAVTLLGAAGKLVVDRLTRHQELEAQYSSRQAELIRLKAYHHKADLLLKEIDDLTLQLDSLKNRIPVNVYNFFESIYRISGQGGEGIIIKNLEINSRNFRLEAVAATPLLIAERFKQSELFSNISIPSIIDITEKEDIVGEEDVARQGDNSATVNNNQTRKQQFVISGEFLQ